MVGAFIVRKCRNRRKSWSKPFVVILNLWI